MKTQTTLADGKIIALGIVVLLVCGTVFWKPWITTSTKTFEVIAEGTVKALPDEYTFNPAYQESGDTTLQATEKVSEKGNTVVAKLKELGVSTDDITTSVSVYQNYSPGYGSGPFIATFTIAASVPDQVLAEKVTTYIATTGATSSVTPQATFKEETRAKLELEARKKSLDAAKAKAEQTASAMGVRLGKITKIADASSSFPVPYPMYATSLEAGKATDSAAPSNTTTLQTGKQEIHYSVTVTYRYY